MGVENVSLPAALDAILKRVGWSVSATVRTVRKARRRVKKSRLSGGDAEFRAPCDPASANSESREAAGNRPSGFPLSPRRLSTFIDFAAEGMQLVFRQRAEGEEDGCSDRLAPAFERLGFDAQSRPRLQQLASFLARLDRKACGRLVTMLEEFARQNPEGRARLNLEHLSFRLSAQEADIGVTGEGIPLRRRQVGLEQLQLHFKREAGEVSGPVRQENVTGVRWQSLPQGFLFDLQGTGDAVQSTFDCGVADWFERDTREERAGGGGKGVSPQLSSETSPASPRLLGEWDHNSRGLASEVSAVDELGVTEILSRFQPQKNAERGGLYRVSNSAFRRADGCEGMVFDYFFGFQQIK